MREQQPRVVAATRRHRLPVVEDRLLHPVDRPVGQHRLHLRPRKQQRRVPQPGKARTRPPHPVRGRARNPGGARRSQHVAALRQPIEEERLILPTEMRRRRRERRSRPIVRVETHGRGQGRGGGVGMGGVRHMRSVKLSVEGPIHLYARGDVGQLCSFPFSACAELVEAPSFLRKGAALRQAQGRRVMGRLQRRPRSSSRT